MVSVGFMPFKRYLRGFDVMFESVLIHFLGDGRLTESCGN